MRDTSLVQLVRLWEQFQDLHHDDHSSDNVADFSRWLAHELLRSPESSSSPTKSRMEPIDTENYTHLPANAQLMIMLTRMGRFTHFYSKKVFDNAPLDSYAEFGILQCVAMKNALKEYPKKHDVITENLLETTTGTESIKKLVLRELLCEEEDKFDKRIKRLRLTEKGKKAIREMTATLSIASRLLAANLTDNKKESLLEALRALNSFHNALYYTGADADVQTLLRELER